MHSLLLRGEKKSTHQFLLLQLKFFLRDRIFFFQFKDMDDPLLLAEDIAEGVKFDFWGIIYTDKSGLVIQIITF